MSGRGTEPTPGLAVLGVDAAWTTTEPSGVALVTFDDGRWTCRGLAPSYQQFVELADERQVDWSRRPQPGAMEVDALLATAHALAGRYPDAIAVDMPLAFDPIVARRRSDAMISTLFGAAGAAVHSPNALRPGLIAGQFRVELEQRGYELRVTETKPPHPLALIETYPHPIAMWLCHSRYRLPYKSHNVGKYWPQLAAADRCRRLLAIWQDIVAAIEPRISGIELPAISQLHGASRGALKAVEDGIDALICAIAGISYVTGAANPIGDRASAIWLPVGCEDYASRPDRYAHFADHTPHQAGQYRRIGAIEHL